MDSNAQPTAYEAVHAPLLADFCSIKDQLQNLPTDIAFRGLEQHQQLIQKSLEPRTIEDSPAFDAALLKIQKFKENQKMDLECAINGPDGVLELMMRCLVALEMAEAEVAIQTFASGLTSLGSGVREMTNYEEIKLLDEKILEYQDQIRGFKREVEEKEEVEREMGEHIKRLKVTLKSCVAGRRSESVEGDEVGKKTENQEDEDAGEDGKARTSPQSNAATSGSPTKEDADIMPEVTVEKRVASWEIPFKLKITSPTAENP